MILTLHIARILHICDEVFSNNFKKYLFSLSYFMVWSLVFKLKRRGCDIFSNDSYHDSRGGGGGHLSSYLVIAS